MQLQHISSSMPNVISITQVRQDIDILQKMLDEHGEVNVLKGQKIFFKAVDPSYEARKKAQKKKAAENIRKFAAEMVKKYPRKPGDKTLTQILIEERDKMRDPKYYESN